MPSPGIMLRAFQLTQLYLVCAILSFFQFVVSVNKEKEWSIKLYHLKNNRQEAIKTNKCCSYDSCFSLLLSACGVVDKERDVGTTRHRHPRVKLATHKKLATETRMKMKNCHSQGLCRKHSTVCARPTNRDSWHCTSLHGHILYCKLNL